MFKFKKRVSPVLRASHLSLRFLKVLNMRLHLSTWPDIEAYLQKSKTIVIPIGSTEQHGPNGLVGTDALCPEIIAEAAAKQRTFLTHVAFICDDPLIQAALPQIAARKRRTGITGAWPIVRLFL